MLIFLLGKGVCSHQIHREMGPLNLLYVRLHRVVPDLHFPICSLYIVMRLLLAIFQFILLQLIIKPLLLCTHVQGRVILHTRAVIVHIIEFNRRWHPLPVIFVFWKIYKLRLHVSPVRGVIVHVLADFYVFRRRRRSKRLIHGIRASSVFGAYPLQLRFVHAAERLNGVIWVGLLLVVYLRFVKNGLFGNWLSVIPI